jgi:hypothetical protein
LALRDNFARYGAQLTESFHEDRAVRYFIRGLLVFTAFRLLLTWPVIEIVQSGRPLTVPSSLVGKIVFAPATLASVSVHLFYGVVVAFVIVALFLKPRYWTGVVFFWLVVNLFRVNLPVITGADFVLLMMSFWAIPLAAGPVFGRERLRIAQIAVFNLFVFLSQLQVVFIYLVSGGDKLMSAVWRSGDAFIQIAHLDTMFNPLLLPVFETEGMALIVSWGTIIFELAFAVLVWGERTRIPILLFGIVFHLAIWVTLALPDFASIMIVSYMIFLKDSDYAVLRSKIKRSLP